ncbi:unnamed protein product [Arabidopsis lyrata]|nr:unnamed protein product [Arabidopsis lyrata]
MQSRHVTYDVVGGTKSVPYVNRTNDISHGSINNVQPKHWKMMSVRKLMMYNIRDMWNLSCTHEVNVFHMSLHLFPPTLPLWIDLWWDETAMLIFQVLIKLRISSGEIAIIDKNKTSV